MGMNIIIIAVIEFQRHSIAPSEASTTFSVDLPLQQPVNEGVLSKPKDQKPRLPRILKFFAGNSYCNIE